MGFEHLWFGGYEPGLHFAWFWLLLIVFWFVGGRRLRAHGHGRQRIEHRYGPPVALPPAASDPALDTLRERFARGEISRAEYEEGKTALLGRPATPAPPVPKGSPAAPDTRPEWPDLT